MKQIALVVGAALLLTACSAPRPSLGGFLPGRPSLTLELGGRVHGTFENGYQWMSFGQTVISDPAARPRQGLPVYRASVGESALLSFSKQPAAFEMTVWRGSEVVAQRTMTGYGFRLPKQPGDYSYEIAAHWGASYVNYDFSVRCVSTHRRSNLHGSLKGRPTYAESR